MKPTILHRYYLKEVVKVFTSVLCGLFGLYILIDYTSRTSGLRLGFTELSQYYFLTFVYRMDILLPFALLVAGIKTLCQSNLRQELVAMRASGISTPYLLRPFFWIALAAMAAIYLNTQFLVPQAAQWINTTEDHYSLNNKRGDMAVHHVTLDDDSRLLYLSYDRSKNIFVNVFWIRSLDDIYRIKTLKPDTSPPIAYQVDHLTRIADGSLVPTAFYDTMTIDEIRLTPEEIAENVILPSERSLTQLWQRLSISEDNVTYTAAQIQAAFYKKMAMPWLCLIALLAPAPLCVVYRRPLRVFFIFAGSIFSLFTLSVMLSMGFTLTQSQLLSPWYALILPSTLLSSITLWRFFRMP